MNRQEARVTANVMKTLAHPIRVLLVSDLTGGDRCVTELCSVADVDQSSISRHLARLKKMGIVSDRRRGMNVVYHLETPCILRAFDCAASVLKARRRGGSMFKSI